MSRALVVVALVLTACKDKRTDEVHHTDKPTAQPSQSSWVACDSALGRVQEMHGEERATELISACEICGGWEPILRWNTPVADGGPKHAAIEKVMTACEAFCSGDAKMKFLGTLDDARGSTSRTPWRQLAVLCKDKVSTASDGRFMSATYFALDRIARAVAARGGEPAARLAKLVLPLPPLTLVGTGPALPEVTPRRHTPAVSGDPVLAAPVGAVQVTLLGDDVYIGRLPKASLGPSGVTVDLGADGYPGRRVAITDLARELDKLAGESRQPVAVLAPKAMTAQRLVQVVVAAAAGLAPVHIAVVTGDDDDWAIPVLLPIELTPELNAAIIVKPEMTVQQVVRALADRCIGEKDRCFGLRIGITAP